MNQERGRGFNIGNIDLSEQNKFPEVKEVLDMQAIVLLLQLLAGCLISFSYKQHFNSLNFVVVSTSKRVSH